MANTVLPWTQYTEAVVGLNHPTLTDTDNRALRQLLSRSGFGPDATFGGLPLGSSVINAGSSDYTGTAPQRITAAVADCVAQNKRYCFIPRFASDGLALLPYAASSVTFNSTVWMIREGGNPLVYDVWAYGANHDGSGGVGTDDAAAISAAIAAANASGNHATVFFPPGQYVIKTTITLTTVVDVVLKGSGRNETLLTMGQAGVTIFQTSGVCTRLQIRDMWIGSFSAFATGGGLNSVNAGFPNTPTSELIVERVSFQNLPNPIYFDNVAQSGLRDVRIVQTIVSATVGVAFYMIRSVSIDLDQIRILATVGNFPLQAVQIDSDCDTVIARHVEAVLLGNNANCIGIHLTDSVGGHPPRIIRLTDCSAENAQTGFLVAAARDVTIHGWEAANNNAEGLKVTGGISVKVLHGQSFLNQTHGIWISGGSGVLVHGNTCSNNSQAANNVSDGIVIGTSDVRVTDNRSGDIFFTLANKQRFGLNLQSGTDHLVVGGNKLQGNLGSGFEAPMTNQSTGASNTFLGSTYAAISEATVVAGVVLEGRAQTTWEITLTAARLVGAPFTPTRGERITYTFIQSGAGAFAVTWNAIFKTSWADAGNATPKRSSISYIYDGTNWNQDGAQTPYV